MSNAIVNRQVNVYINSGEAQKALDKLIAKEKILKDEIAKTTDPKKIANLNKELAKLSEPIDRATKKLKGELTPSFRELQAAAARAIAEFKKTGDPAMLAQYSKFNAELQKQKDLIDKANNAQKGLTSKGIFSAAFWGSLAAGGIQAATSALSNFFRTSIDEAINAEQATSRLRNTLDNLGKTEVFDRMVSKANEMAERFKFLDNDDVLGVFKKLIDYGKLTEKQMNDLLPVIIDFASNARISLEEATDVITKALEGNGKALKTYGIDIKDAGTETERLNIIMTTLKSKVDGAADAFGNSMAGQLATTRQQFNNMAEDLGNTVLPILTRLGNLAVQTANNLKTFGKAVKEALSGGTGFFAINQDAIKQDPNFRATINMLVEQRVATFDAVQKEVEKSLGRKLTSSKEDQQTLKDVQDKILEGFLALAKRAQATIDELKKNFKNNSSDGQELRASMETLEASLQAISEINSRSTGVVGVSQTAKEKVDKTTKSVKDLHAELKKLLEISRTAQAFLEDVSITSETEAQRLRREQEDRLSKPAESNAAAAQRRNVGILNSVFDSNSRNNTAGLQLRLIQAHGKEKLAAELAILNDEEKQELQKKGITENEKLLIEEQFRQKRKEKETEHWKNIADTTIFFAQQAVNVLDTLFSAANAKEDAQLARDKKVNDTKKENFKRQLDGKMISQLEYDRQIRKLDKEQAKLEYEAELKKFKRNQITSISQALINGAQGATKTIAELGFPAAIPFLIAEGAAVLAQVIAISKQKPAPPVAFARGGKLGGRSHAQGGNPILDGSGQKIAEIEAGEGIINKRSMGDGRKYTLSGTPSQIASSINRLHGGVDWESGATLIPQWRTIQPQRMNFSAMKRAYAGGGVFQAADNRAQNTADINEMKAVLEMNTQIMAQLSQQLKTPLKAYTLITEHEKTQDRLNSIRDDATMKG